MSTAHEMKDRWTALGLFGATFIVLLLTERAVGFVRDESVYFAAGERYARWLQLLFRAPGTALTDASISHYFQYNSEHPALMKLLFGASYLVFHEAFGWVRPATAFRLPAFAVAATIPAGVYLLGARVFSRPAALFAAIGFYLVPRHFFHAHLAAFDVPIAAAWLYVAYFFLRAQEGGGNASSDVVPNNWRVITDAFRGGALRRQRPALLAALTCGVTFGLALATKHNAFFLPLVLGPFAAHAAYSRARKSAPDVRWVVKAWGIGLHVAFAFLVATMVAALGPKGFFARFTILSPHSALVALYTLGTLCALAWLFARDEGTFRAVAPLAAMFLVGPLIFYLHWPYLWHQPVTRAAEYLGYHLRHEHYAWFYLGELLREPPFPLEYVLVKTALTLPLSLLVPSVIGSVTLTYRAGVALMRGGHRHAPTYAELFVGANALASIAIISHPNVPHFGGVKHWLPSMPFLLLLAGNVVWRVAQRVPRAGKLAFPALCALLLVPALWGTWRIHPYGTSAYGELAGGVTGAASLGMQRQYWSNNVTGVLPWINEHAPDRARVWLHEVRHESFRDYQRNGMLRMDLIPATGPHDADIAAYQYHQEFREQEFAIWQAFGTTRPVHGLYVDETPQVVVYQKTAREDPSR